MTRPMNDMQKRLFDHLSQADTAPSGPTWYDAPRVLTYDPAIYWLLPYVYAEYTADRGVLDSDPGAMRAISDELDYALAQEAKHAGWGGYTAIDQPHEDDLFGRRTFRRHAYEQPGFTYIRQIPAPPGIHALRIKPVGGTPIDLSLRQLMYHGERMRGALHGTELYVIEAIVVPPGVEV